mgnify:CR=1 FL=1|tara:strand:- start:36921 stop:37232 length:312 start_codon:yes stop_codon:yes gene_type:complete
MLEASIGYVARERTVKDLVERVRKSSDAEVDELVHEKWMELINDPEQFKEYWLLTRDIGQDRIYCRYLGVKDYPNLPTNDWRRVQLFCLYLIEEYGYSRLPVL